MRRQAFFRGAARDTAYLVLAEICFVLGIRNARMARELGKPDPFVEAKSAAMQARRLGLVSLIEMMGHVHRAVQENRLQALVEMAQSVPLHKAEIEPWLQLEMSARSKAWLDELEAAVFNAHNASILTRLPPGNWRRKVHGRQFSIIASCPSGHRTNRVRRRAPPHRISRQRERSRQKIRAAMRRIQTRPSALRLG